MRLGFRGFAHSRLPIPDSRSRGFGQASLVASIATSLGVDPNLAVAVAQQESGFNPNALSSAGAQGEMQLMPATAAQLGVTNPFDPTQNITAGISYLKALLTQFGGDTASALAAYNWGPGNVAAAQAAYGDSWLNYAPSETQNYVTKIMGQLGLPLPGGSSGTGGGWDLSSLTDPTTLIFAAAGALALYYMW